MDEWRAIDRGRLTPTLQARPVWAESVAAAYAKFVPAPMLCELDDGTRCIIPLMRRTGRLGWRVFVGTPLSGYTAVLDENGSQSGHATTSAALAHILARLGDSVTIMPWPLSGFEGDGLPPANREVEISVIDLAGGADVALSRMDGKARRMAGQAERRGVTCSRSRDHNVVDTYYDMLCESAVRWGREKPTFTKRLLNELVERGGDDVEIWFAYFEGAVIAGGIMLYGADEANYWSAAMRSEFGALRPNNALNIALIHAAAARGVHWYNLGASPGLPGVKRFKEGLGAVAAMERTWTRESPAFSTIRRLRDAVTGRRGQ